MSVDLRKLRRIVVKIGSSLLIDAESGALRRDWLAAVSADMAELKAGGSDVVVVTSGAIALGRTALGLGPPPLRLEESQAAAACGQIVLAHAYREAFGAQGVAVGQILLTIGDTEERRRYLNARNTLSTLLKLGVVPVINENDTVATSEIRFGDNDRLAARVAAMVSADGLVLLSDIDGLYSTDPSADPAARFIPEVARLTPEIMAMAGAARSEISRGGMVTKLDAARVALAAGCHMAIASGLAAHPLRALAEGARCTWFLPEANPGTARKRWIAGSLKPMGSVTVDDGAARALAAGKSLLPAGVTAVSGSFERGDAVLVMAPDGSEIGRGLSAYSVADAARIKGHHSGEIEALLGYRGREELVHRDDLVLRR